MLDKEEDELMQTYSTTLLQTALSPLLEALSSSKDSVPYPAKVTIGVEQSPMPDQEGVCAFPYCQGRMQSHQQSMLMLLQLLQEKCFFLYHHSLRVQCLARSLAQSLSLSRTEVSTIELAALFHDVGKILLSHDILQKPGRLTHQEFGQIKQHSAFGAQILRGMRMPAEIVSLVYHHHEHYDGSGYPNGIAGDAIPLGARIIALCDTFDAMTSYRPYHHPRTPAQALTELQRCAGTQFDPDLASYFCAMFVTEELSASPYSYSV
ncbi:MAG: HD-GYP domain-containing protein [Chloroflexi bacterium]|nr:MAG: HD-GYP domain-containing protein [Chloroflexota bacterium]